MGTIVVGTKLRFQRLRRALRRLGYEQGYANVASREIHFFKPLTKTRKIHLILKLRSKNICFSFHGDRKYPYHMGYKIGKEETKKLVDEILKKYRELR